MSRILRGYAIIGALVSSSLLASSAPAQSLPVITGVAGANSPGSVGGKVPGLGTGASDAGVNEVPLGGPNPYPPRETETGPPGLNQTIHGTRMTPSQASSEAAGIVGPAPSPTPTPPPKAQIENLRREEEQAFDRGNGEPTAKEIQEKRQQAIINRGLVDHGGPKRSK